MPFLKTVRMANWSTGKSDCSNAFHILPILCRHCSLLVMKTRHPVTKLWYYFIDKCLPFRSSISCARFQSFSDALRHIVVWKLKQTKITKLPEAITNHLDDFLFIALSFMACNGMMNVFLKVCCAIGCPILMEKMEWASVIMVFLGLLLNGQTHTISIPLDKKLKAVNLLKLAIDHRRLPSNLFRS